MSRLQADLLLLVAAIIWGTAFIAQKTGMEGLGPYTFIGIRFVLSFLVVLPFSLRELRNRKAAAKSIGSGWVVLLCASFTLGVIFQQVGIQHTSVTNAGFLTGLYVVGVPLVAWLLFRRPPAWIMAPICLLAVSGAWLLNGASLTTFRSGDLMIIVCAICFSVQVVMLGHIVQKTGLPFAYSVLQSAVCAIAALALAFVLEDISMAAIIANAPQLIYAGVISGGIAYTLQAVCQQHTPPADAAIILSGEALFAALAGVWLLGDHLDPIGWLGCGLILAAILLVEVGTVYLSRRRILKRT